MAPDYDAPRRTADDETDKDGIAALRAQSTAARGAGGTGVEDEANLGEDLELPGADLSHEELLVRVLPKQADEFTCSRCFLVAHTSQRAKEGPDVCRDCA